MDICLTMLIQWPQRDRIHATKPWWFRPHYRLRVTSIIDCFELFIEKPIDLMSKTATWSTYKHYNTVKCLISITTQGTVNFISKGYTGRASDKYITEDCGYLNTLQAGDVVLADQGQCGIQRCTSKYSSIHKGEVSTFLCRCRVNT